MKLPKIDRTTLDFLIRVSQYGTAIEFEDFLFQTFYRNALQSLISKLVKTKTRIKETYALNLTLEQSICIRWTLEIWQKESPGTLADNVLREYFEPLNKAA